MVDYLLNATASLLGANGLTIVSAVLLLFFLISFLCMISDYKIGLMVWFLLNSCALIWFQSVGYDTTFVVAAMFLSLVIMAFSIFLTRHGGQVAG